ncbi:type IV pilus twitching motility protein PilT [Paludibacterium yongneupense]|uniref:type IV pilus twitching motility protein PilT n=1 Tax=Paludibacterium yongneupense TaxID=400061 RepID=UPI0003FA8EE0|nr:PilT/PilU family type 4a pilus ATPase [Paludibacterium yongneupense]
MQIDELLALAIDRRASDLHLSSGHPPLLRIDGELRAVNRPPLAASDLDTLLAGMLDAQRHRRLLRGLGCDFCIARASGERFRASAFLQHRGVALALRPIPVHIPELETLHSQRALYAITALRWGLVVLCGATGCGKSTTMAALINHINHRHRLHVLMFEDPIEFLHQSDCSLIQQCILPPGHEARVLRGALRADPDILVIGEMRDAATIRLALSAARTGHLVLATLHATSAAQAVERLEDAFPAQEKDSARSALSESLRAIVAQRLIRRADGRGRIALREILIATPAVSRLIRERKSAQLEHVMQTGDHYGMTTYAQSLRALIASGAVAASTPA